MHLLLGYGEGRFPLIPLGQSRGYPLVSLTWEGDEPSHFSIDMKYYKYKGQDVYLEKNHYANNGSLAVAMLSRNGRDLLSILTVNLSDSLQSENLAYLDENNEVGIGKWMVENGLGLPVGHESHNGACSYPLYTIFTSRF